MTVPTRETEARKGVAGVCQQRCIHPEQVRAVREQQLSTDVARSTANVFAVLADPTRLQVLYALFSAPGGELCLCDLAAGLCRDETTISHQLRVLRTQHLVATRKVGRVVYYRLVDEHIRHLLQVGLSHENLDVDAVQHSPAEVFA